MSAERTPAAQEDEVNNDHDEIMEEVEEGQSPEPDDLDPTPRASPVKLEERRKSKQRGALRKEPTVEDERVVERQEQTADEMEEQQDEEEEDSSDALSAEQVQLRKHASESFTALAEQFAVFRNK